MKAGPSLRLLDGDGANAFSYSEIRWNEGLGRFPLLSSEFNRAKLLDCTASLGERVADEPAGAAPPSRGARGSPAAGRWSVGKPYWEVLVKSEVLDESVDTLESSVGSGCIKSGGENGRREG